MSNVISLEAKRKEREFSDTKLHVSYLIGKATGDGPPRSPEMFSERMTRIKASLEKIGQLVDDLKTASHQKPEDSKDKPES